MVELKPGERKVLEALKKESLNYTELKESTGFSNNTITKNVKKLWKAGYIGREIEGRKYFMKKISYASLLFHDVNEFIESYLEKQPIENLKDSITVYENAILKKETISPSWILLTEAETESRNLILETLKENQKVRSYFVEISLVLEKLWSTYILSKREDTVREIITTYRDFLLNYYNVVRKPIKSEILIGHKGFFFELAKFKLQKSFPDVEIPKEMIFSNVKKELEKWKENQDQINQPYDLQDLKDKLKSLEEGGRLRSKEDLTDKDNLELKETLEFLENPHNRKIYETFIYSRDFERPKTLFISPLWGFQGQIEKLTSMFPELFQQIKDGYFELTDKLLKNDQA